MLALYEEQQWVAACAETECFYYLKELPTPHELKQDPPQNAPESKTVCLPL